jgi:N-acetylmuramic acid 6-phosphate etherase
MVKIGGLDTEKRNPRTMNLDAMSTHDILTVMNEEDENVISAVRQAIPQIEQAVDLIVAALNAHGRVIYMGAGTSGRLGVLDAAECIPTFSADNQVIALLAGGNDAFVRAREGAEDSAALAVEDLRKAGYTPADIVVGIAASGRTPYVVSALKYAASKGGKTVAVACNRGSEIGRLADVAIEADAGPEVLSGSTRLKAGTCQKIILNMLSTTAMIRIGKVYENLMVDMKATNEKLVERAKGIVTAATGCTRSRAEQALAACGYRIKTAIVMIQRDSSAAEAQRRLDNADGFVRKALE